MGVVVVTVLPYYSLFSQPDKMLNSQLKKCVSRGNDRQFVCCSDVRMKTPYSATRDKDSVHYTYLDTVGRPVITLRKDNLVEQHILDFEVLALLICHTHNSSSCRLSY